MAAHFWAATYLDKYTELLFFVDNSILVVWRRIFRRIGSFTPPRKIPKNAKKTLHSGLKGCKM